jgi:hypothetical protein
MQYRVAGPAWRIPRVSVCLQIDLIAQIKLSGGESTIPDVGPINIREFARFFVSGVTATVANMLTVWFVRRFLSFQMALVGGIAIAILISFIFSRVFAFRSFEWTRAPVKLRDF